MLPFVPIPSQGILWDLGGHRWLNRGSRGPTSIPGYGSKVRNLLWWGRDGGKASQTSLRGEVAVEMSHVEGPDRPAIRLGECSEVESDGLGIARFSGSSLEPGPDSEVRRAGLVGNSQDLPAVRIHRFAPGCKLSAHGR